MSTIQNNAPSSDIYKTMWGYMGGPQPAQQTAEQTAYWMQQGLDPYTGMDQNSWQSAGLTFVGNLIEEAARQGLEYNPKPEDFYHELNARYDKEHPEPFSAKIIKGCSTAAGGLFSLVWGAAKAEAVKESVTYAKNNMKGNGNGFFFEKNEKQYPHLVDTQGMRRFKDLISIKSHMAVKGAIDCASKTNAECMSIDVDAFNMLKANSIHEASMFYIECLKHDTPQCSWATGEVFSEIAFVHAERAGKIAQECASIPSKGCSQIDIRAFDTLIEKDPSEALIFAQECADKPTVQCSTLGKQAHDSLAAKSASKAAALKKRCENITTPQCVEMKA